MNAFIRPTIAKHLAPLAVIPLAIAMIASDLGKSAAQIAIGSLLALGVAYSITVLTKDAFQGRGRLRATWKSTSQALNKILWFCTACHIPTAVIVAAYSNHALTGSGNQDEAQTIAGLLYALGYIIPGGLYVLISPEEYPFEKQRPAWTKTGSTSALLAAILALGTATLSWIYTPVIGGTGILMASAIAFSVILCTLLGVAIDDSFKAFRDWKTARTTNEA